MDFRSLRPSELVRLLNSTPLGKVICERQLYRHRSRAGYQIGGKQRIDLYRYVAWLADMRRERNQQRVLRIDDMKEEVCFKPNNRHPTKLPSGSVNLSNVLALLEFQGHRCALTGRKMSPEGAALDHILPISRGGAHCIENAQVLDKGVNRAKGTLTNEEFIELCRQVVAYADSRPQFVTREGVLKDEN